MAPARILPAALALALALGGCGGSSSHASTSEEVAAGVRAAAAKRRAAEARAPRGASPTLRAIYATFPPPRPDLEVKGSAAAIAAGERACAHKTPLQVKDAYFPAALAKGKLKPASEEAKMIARIGTFEKHASTDQSFAAGQLAADAYEATLPAASGQYGYQGCVYSLAQALERKLAP